MLSKILRFMWHLPRELAAGVITIYQKTLSPDHGVFSEYLKPHCRFTPTCSEYGKLSIRKYGFLRGSVKTAWRILRCNPWNKGGLDLP